MNNYLQPMDSLWILLFNTARLVDGANDASVACQKVIHPRQTYGVVTSQLNARQRFNSSLRGRTYERPYIDTSPLRLPRCGERRADKKIAPYAVFAAYGLFAPQSCYSVVLKTLRETHVT